MDAPLDLTDCDREPIHIPGSIQPHGAMLVAHRTSQEIAHAAGDVARFTGRPQWIGRTLGEALGDGFAEDLARLTDSAPVNSFWRRELGGGPADVSAHLSGDWLIVELEPALGAVTAAAMLSGLEAAAAAFERADTLQKLCDRAAASFRRLTGFDRVMVYRFLDDGVGQVISEDKAERLHSFLNHHFPASDIPVQARALYVRNLVRVIPDAGYVPQPMVPALADPADIDMSDAILRSVSPIHLQYLKNMGVVGSASVSIVKDGALWGLIACHHETARLLPYDTRAACRALAGALARQIKAKEEAQAYQERLRLRAFEDQIVPRLTAEGPLDAQLTASLGELRAMLGADGAAVLRAGEVAAVGVHPSEAQIRALADWVLAQPETVLATHELAVLYGPAERFRETASGLLAAVVAPQEAFVLLWFRAELVEHIEWAGNPHKAVEVTPGEQLTPRASFEAWRETVRGFAPPWTAAEVEAAGRLAGALLDVLQRRQLRHLNQQLTATLEEKDVLIGQKDLLLKEVNHRVQNSLQIVSSFLGLQARQISDPQLRGALDEARRRLGAVGLVHRRLYRADQIDAIELSRYLEELVEEMLTAGDAAWRDHIRLQAAPITVSTDRAVTLGLVLTELVINANKYAYGGAPGPIDITLEDAGQELRLTVADRGGGKQSASEGFGSRMLRAMVVQLHGRMEQTDNAPGLRTTVTCPIRAQVIAPIEV